MDTSGDKIVGAQQSSKHVKNGVIFTFLKITFTIFRIQRSLNKLWFTCTVQIDGKKPNRFIFFQKLVMNYGVLCVLPTKINVTWGKQTISPWKALFPVWEGRYTSHEEKKNTWGCPVAPEIHLGGDLLPRALRVLSILPLVGEAW